VLDLGTIIAGPYTATLLGELGAEVLKLERPPLGDEFRIAHGGRGGIGFSVYNRDQRSLLLDLAADRGREIFAELVRSSDVVVDNYRAGVLHRLGIDHASSARSTGTSAACRSARSAAPGRWDAARL
jgi:formyl-CoA transferase